MLASTKWMFVLPSDDIPTDTIMESVNVGRVSKKQLSGGNLTSVGIHAVILDMCHSKQFLISKNNEVNEIYRIFG